MKGKLVGNVFQFVTDVPACYKDKALKPATDDKGDPIYFVQYDTEGDWAFSKFGIKCNSVVDDKLAIVAVVPDGVTMDDIKEQFGYAAVAANAYIPVIIDATVAEQSVIDSCFE